MVYDKALDQGRANRFVTRFTKGSPKAPQLKRQKFAFVLPLLIIDPFVFGDIGRRTDIGKTIVEDAAPPEALAGTRPVIGGPSSTAAAANEKARRAAIAGRPQRDHRAKPITGCRP